MRRRLLFAPDTRRLFSILGALTLSAACMYAMGFLIVVACLDARTAQVLCYALYFVMPFLLGATIPAAYFPDSPRMVSEYMPMTYAVNLAQNAFTA